MVAQELSEFGDHELKPPQFKDEEDREVRSSCVDIWEDTDCLMFLKEGVLPDAIDYEGAKRIRKRANNYCWKEQKLFFKALLVPKYEERVFLVRQMHKTWGILGNNGRWQRFDGGNSGTIELKTLRQ